MVGLVALALALPAQTTLHGLFADNMVLQRNKPIPVWGTAEPGQKVVVTLGNDTQSTVAGSRGSWMVTLKPEAASTGNTLVITGDRKLVVQNVAVGEVWVCSGQSNMEWPTSAAANGPAEVASADFPDIRLYHDYHRSVGEILKDQEGRWNVCRPDTVKNFSAIGFFYGRLLYQKLHVPIGLIEADWGGTPIESWIPRSAFMARPELRNIVTSYESSLANVATLVDKYRKEVAAYTARMAPPDPGNEGVKKGFAEPAYDDSTWEDVPVPANYKAALKLDVDGSIWYRKTFDMQRVMVGDRLELDLGIVKDYDVTYFNGVEIGSTSKDAPEAAARPRRYTVPGNLVKSGKNTIAIRVFNVNGAGGLMGEEPLELKGPTGARLNLEGTWKFAVENGVPARPWEPAPDLPLIPGNPWVPTSLYNGMIASLQPFAIKGVIWYQGESNADHPQPYRALFEALIEGWRSGWGQGDFPFYFVQLANFQARLPDPSESTWAELREAQAAALKLPNTAMACTIDLGIAESIHPLDKQDVAKRLSLIALNRLYGMGGIDAGPTYKSMTVIGNAILVRFDNTGGGLISRDGPAKGFAVAGSDGKFYWADAKVQGFGVLVSSPKVPHPVSVRYAWANNPECNMYNGAGLPMVPFRSDGR